MSERSVRPHLSQRQAAADCINQALEASDIAEICHAIGAATHLHNVSDIARKSGIERGIRRQPPRTGSPAHVVPKIERELPQWAIVIEWLMLVGEHGGDPMVPRIGMMKALLLHEPSGTAPETRQSLRAPEEQITLMVLDPCSAAFVGVEMP